VKLGGGQRVGTEEQLAGIAPGDGDLAQLPDEVEDR
jgi:hypothetical protein